MVKLLKFQAACFFYSVYRTNCLDKSLLHTSDNYCATKINENTFHCHKSKELAVIMFY